MRAGLLKWPILRKVVLFAVLLGFFLGGCAAKNSPDLSLLYSKRIAPGSRTPVIVIPGVLGSRLVDQETAKEVWPVGTWNLLFGSQFTDLSLPITTASNLDAVDQLRPSGLFYEAVGKDFYQNLIDALVGPGGYNCVTVDRIGASTNCVLFSWDWRRDIVEAAAKLDQLIDRLRVLRDDPELNVDIVAHSAGGLVARYFVRYGARDILNDEQPIMSMAGAQKVRKAVLIGTPNFGSTSALQRAIMGAPIGLTSIKPEVLATMPILYELFPHPDRTWMIDPAGNRLDIDLYDVSTWKEMAWSIFNQNVRARIENSFATSREAENYLAAYESFFKESLLRGKRFHRALSIPIETEHTQYIVFGSACRLTPSRCLLEQVEGMTKIRLLPDEVTNRIPGVDYDRLMLEPGDGSVTKASLLAGDGLAVSPNAKGDFPIEYAVFICADHNELPANMTFRDNLLNILIY